MHTPEIQMPHPGRRRGRYSNDFKRQVIAACLAPGVSTAAIALSNGLNHGSGVHRESSPVFLSCIALTDGAVGDSWRDGGGTLFEMDVL